MIKQKLMILGAGKDQLPIIKLAQKNNLEIVLVSPKGNYPGLNLVKNIYYEDVADKIKILEIAKKEKINAIISDQIDVAIPTIGFVNDKLNLHGINYECSLSFTNKYKMKEMAKLCGINVIPFEKTTNLKEAQIVCLKIKYPVVIKPISSTASRGIFIIHSPEELIKYFPVTQKASSDGQVLIEKYIKGQEFVVDGFVDNYKNNNLIIGKSFNYNLKNLCISATRIFKSVNTNMDHIEEQILLMQDFIVQNFSPIFGNIHGEYIYDYTSDRIYLNEIAIRGGGCCTTTHIVPYLCNINTIEILFKNVMRIKNEYNFDKIEPGYCAYITCLLPEGEIYSIKGLDEINSSKYVIYNFISVDLLNRKSYGVRDKSSKVGPILLYSKNYNDLMSVINYVKSKLSIKIRTKTGEIKNAIWY